MIDTFPSKKWLSFFEGIEGSEYEHTLPLSIIDEDDAADESEYSPRKTPKR